MARKLTEREARTVMRMAKLTPLEPYISSGKPWKCRCQKCKSISRPTLGNIRQGGGGCSTCGQKLRAGRRKLSEEITVRAMIKKGLKPLEPYKKAVAKWKCQCLVCKRITYPTYWNTRNSKSKKRGCAICVGVKVDAKEVKEKMLLAGLKTYGPYPGKDVSWKCKCLTCGITVFPTWNNIRKGQGGCGKCRYVKSARSNRTPEKVAIAKMLKASLQPLEPYFNQFTPWKSICLDCDNLTFPMLANISKGQGGCSFCRETGLNYADPAYIYLLFHKEFQSLKIGVSNQDSRPNRLKAHHKQGWTTFKVKDFKTGAQAEGIETKVLRWLRKERQLGIHLAPKHMPQGGHSETVDAAEIDLATIWAKVEKLSKVKK